MSHELTRPVRPPLPVPVPGATRTADAAAAPPLPPAPTPDASTTYGSHDRVPLADAEAEC